MLIDGQNDLLHKKILYQTEKLLEHMFPIFKEGLKHYYDPNISKNFLENYEE